MMAALSAALPHEKKKTDGAACCGSSHCSGNNGSSSNNKTTAASGINDITWWMQQRGWLWWRQCCSSPSNKFASSSPSSSFSSPSCSRIQRVILALLATVGLLWLTVSVPWHYRRYQRHQVMMQHMKPPRLNCSIGDTNGATTTAATTLDSSSSRSFQVFTILFDLSSNKGSNSNFQKTKALGLTRLSLASAVHWGAPLTIVTHESNQAQIAQFSQLAREPEFAHVRVLVIPDAEVGLGSSGGDDNSNNATTTTAVNWVKLVEDFKIAYLKRNLGQRVVYLELDMLFLPGVGQALQEQLDGPSSSSSSASGSSTTTTTTTSSFDMALCYYPASVRRRRHAFGSINSGFIVLQSSPAVIALFAKVASVLDAKFQKQQGQPIKGGENQKIMDDILQYTFVPPGQQYTTRFDFALPADLLPNEQQPPTQQQQHTLTIKSLPVPGPFNRPFTYMWENCCDLMNWNDHDHAPDASSSSLPQQTARDPQDGTPIYIVHFVGPKKRTIMSSCCRDLAFPNPCGGNGQQQKQQVAYYQEWKDSCYCTETTCSSVYGGGDNDWCSTG